MKRTYIPSEYNTIDVFGTMVTKEYKTFFGTPMVKLPISFNIYKDSIVYYQNINNEQLDIKKEMLLTSNVLNSDFLKKDNITCEIGSNGDIIFNIKHVNIFNTYILALLKKNRVFDGLTKDMTPKNDVDLFILDYIINNITNVYSIFSLDFYIEYINLDTAGNIGLFYYDSTIESEVNYTNKYKIQMYNDHLTITLKPVVELKTSTFKYYYNLTIKK